MTTQSHRKDQICTESLQRVLALTTRDKHFPLTIEGSPNTTKIAINTNQIYEFKNLMIPINN
jgi:hypothetical protein